MTINEKDRSQLLRMAGNIACGLCSFQSHYVPNEKQSKNIAEASAFIALETMKEVDRLIAENNIVPANDENIKFAKATMRKIAFMEPKS